MSMEDYKKLVNRLRDEPKDSRKAVLSIYDLCIDAAYAIEILLDKLKYAEGERDAVTRHMIELEQEVCRLKSRLAAYEDSGLEPEDLNRAFNETAIIKLAAQALNTTPDHLRDIIKAEQDGRLVVLPCKLGDDVWFVRKFGKGQCIKRAEVSCINIDFRGEVFVSARRISGGYIGKTVFLNREEAEAALALKGGEG